MSGVSSVSGDSPSVARFWQHSIGDHVMVLAWSPGGDMVAAGAVSGSVTIFDGGDGKIRHVMPVHIFGLTQYAPDVSVFWLWMDAWRLIREGLQKAKLEERRASLS